jgi:hypothetical protein
MAAVDAARAARSMEPASAKPARPPILARAQVDRLADARMNKTERSYARHLERMLAAREIARWDFEPVTLRIGPVMFYTPDFRLIMPDGIEVFDDTKALWRPTKKYPERVGWKEDARAKIKAAAELHPYIFRGAVEIKAGVWKIECFGRSLKPPGQR